MDEYELEIQNVRRTLAELRERHSRPELIEEYEAELRNLRALYRAATDTLAAGASDRRLAVALDQLGYGAWSLANVYSFVYDLAFEIDAGDRDFAAIVDQTDFAGSLLEVLD